jgi:bisphosphoglycerate-independent phosphoglycerate mutase (AlkP superfamily)
MEDLSTRRHTANPVPALIIGDPKLRAEFVAELSAITDIAPAILKLFLRKN